MIAAVVLTGFLGSGKTTLLGRLLRRSEFSRTAVIINEFGDVGLDHDLVEASQDSVVALQTGCLCCMVRSDLAATLHDLLERRDRGTVAAFTRVVIETSGLADPAPILQTLMTDETIAGRIALRGVVTTVDAVTGAATLEREEVSVKQVALADRLVLTKTDLVKTDPVKTDPVKADLVMAHVATIRSERIDLGDPDPAGAAESALLRRLAALNRAAPVLRVCHGEIDPRDLFGDRLDDSPTAALDVQAWLGSPTAAHRGRRGGAAARRRGGFGRGSGDEHHHHVDTFTVLRHTPIRAVTLTLFLETLAEHCGADLLRLKGIVDILESPDRPAVIHGVQHVFHAPAWLARWPSADRRSRIVFITRRVPRAFVEALLAALEAEVAAVSDERGE